MLISGITFPHAQWLTACVGNVLYEGNLSLVRTSEIHETRFRAVIRPLNSRGAGTRTSATGRHGPYACWHAFRDVIFALLYHSNRGRIVTGMARYTTGNFLATFPATGRVNQGSMINPVTMPDLCACTDSYDAPPQGVQVPAFEPGIAPLPIGSARPTRAPIRVRLQENEDYVRLVVVPAPEPEPPQYVRNALGNMVDPGDGLDYASTSTHGDIIAKIDDVLRNQVVPDEGFCGACGKPTGSDAMSFCSQSCQVLYEARRNWRNTMY